MALAAGLGPFAGILALALHTSGVLGRLFAEALQNAPPRPRDALLEAGAPAAAAFLYGTLPEVSPQLIAYSLYRWEMNIRMAAILGFVGAGGLGQLLYVELSLFHYAQASTVIAAMLLLSANRLKWPEVREAGTNEWKKISWNEAIERIAKHMKADRDANFMAQNKDGVTVNRWPTTGFLASSAAPNEAGYLTVKTLRALGMTAARHPGTYLTRSHGSQSGSEFWAWCDDQPLGGHQERRSCFGHGRQPRRSAPCGFKWVIEAKKTRKAKLIVVDPRFNRTARWPTTTRRLRPGTDIAFLGGVINYLLPTTRCITSTSSTTPTPLPDRPGFGSRTAVLRLRRGQAQLRQGHLEVPDGCRRFRQGRRDPAGPELRLPADEEALFALHAGDGEQGLRHAEGCFPQGLRNTSPTTAAPTRR
jgi:hypothetical protein